MNKDYKSVVISGLQRLITLRLRGCPPAETIHAVAEVWLDALHGCGDWEDKEHLQGLVEAFKTAERTLDHFPAPVEIRRLKPTVVSTHKALPPPPQDKAKVAQIFAEIFGILKVNNDEKSRQGLRKDV